MLSAERLPQILESNLSDGIEGLVLMTDMGNLLSSAIIRTSSVNETILTAVSSSIWGTQGASTSNIQMHISKMDNGYLAICPVGKGYVIAAFGTNVECGLLKSRLENLSEYFVKIFEQLKS